MGDLEIKIVAEDTGNYDEEDIEYIVETAQKLREHIGFKDNRRDDRYIVKFHDIYYYMPEEYEKEHQEEYNYLFNEFCDIQADSLESDFFNNGIDIESMLHPMYVGHYQAFVVDIPEITEKNIPDLAMRTYDEFGYKAPRYVDNYIYVTNELQDLEDNYMKYWIEYLEDGELMPKKIIEEIKDKYHKDLERRKAK